MKKYNIKGRIFNYLKELVQRISFLKDINTIIRDEKEDLK